MVLAACAPTVGTSIAPTPVPFMAPATPSPTATTPTPTSSHISGLVQVTDRAGSFLADVSVRGLPIRVAGFT